MTPASIRLLLNALTDDAVYVMGAGASVPHVPTLGQMPDILAGFAPQLGAYPAEAIPDSPLRRLIQPLIDRARSPRGEGLIFL